MDALPGKAAVVGAGRMGAQIGAEYALGGYDTILITRGAASGARALREATSAIRFLVAEGLVSDANARRAVDRLAVGGDIRRGCEGAQIVVESVVERLATKAEVLATASAAAPSAILASNTSSFSISALGDAAGVGERLVGTHYWNPPTLLPLVEVVPGTRTTAAVREQTVAILRALGKEPIVVADVPGFVWNRLQFALLREAASLVRAGVVSAPDLDRIVIRGLARRWSLVGPLDTMALGGRETFLAIAGQLFGQLSRQTAVDDLAALPEPPASALTGLMDQRDRQLADLRRRDLQPSEDLTADRE